MKYLFALSFLLFSFLCFSQSVNGIELSEIDANYISITQDKKTFTNKSFILLDYGQAFKTGIWKEAYFIMNEKGKRMEFNSMIDALNFINQYGYEYHDSHVSMSETNSRLNYVLKKTRE